MPHTQGKVEVERRMGMSEGQRRESGKGGKEAAGERERGEGRGRGERGVRGGGCVGVRTREMKIDVVYIVYL